MAEHIRFPVERVMKQIGRTLAKGGAVAAEFHSAAERMKRTIPYQAIETTIDLPRIWNVLRHAAIDAHSRDVTVTLIRAGFHVRKGRRSEIVRWEQADIGLLNRAIDRVDGGNDGQE